VGGGGSLRLGGSGVGLREIWGGGGGERVVTIVVLDIR
jgi:hypothetical protein